MQPSPSATRELRPPLKWAGGKRWLVPQLQPLWNAAHAARLVEPFCGGLAVALGLQPAHALLNDHNRHLINFYRWLQRGLVIDLPMENDSALYYRHRERFNALVRADQADSSEAAALFYYLNRTGYNGLCRFNRRDEFNVPFGRYKSIPYQRDFRAYIPLLSAWTFSHGDFETLTVTPDHFVYADPPYDVEFTQYSQHRFGWDDQQRLAVWLSRLPCPVVLSNQATPRIVALYTALGFDVHLLSAPRRISSSGDRTDALEILATRSLRPLTPTS